MKNAFAIAFAKDCFQNHKTEIGKKPHKSAEEELCVKMEKKTILHIPFETYDDLFGRTK